MLKRNISQSKNLKRKLVFTFVIIELIIFLLGFGVLAAEIYFAKYYNGSVEFARPMSEMLSGIKLLNLYYIIVILFMLLPAIYFYEYFTPSKSIYTMLRLPGKGSRFKFYIDQLTCSIKGLLAFWILQLILLLFFYLIYIIILPNESIPKGLWLELWKSHDVYRLYPFTKPLFFIPLVFMPFLLPNMGILMALTERSRKRSLLSVFGLIISVIAIYTYAIGNIHSVWIVPLTTCMSIAISIYYFYRVEIV